MGKYEKPRTIDKLMGSDQPCLAVCAGKHCAKAGTKQLLHAAQTALTQTGLTGQVTVALTKCQDYCDHAPAVTVMPDNYTYTHVTAFAMLQLVQEHLVHGQPMRVLMHKRSRRRFDKSLFSLYSQAAYGTD